MKIFGRIVGTVYILCGVALAIFFLTIWANENYITTSGEFLKSNLTTVGIIGVALVLLGIIYIVNWFEYINKTRNVSFDNPGGKVKISLKAIEDSITSLIKKEIDGIKSLKIKNYVSPNGLETKIYLQIVSGISIPDTCSTIQEITKNYLQDAVGVERVSNIEINVTNISEGNFSLENYSSQNAEEQEEDEDET